MTRFNQTQWAAIDAALDNARSVADSAGDAARARAFQEVRDAALVAHRDNDGRLYVNLNESDLSLAREAVTAEVELARTLRDATSLTLLEAALDACN